MWLDEADVRAQSSSDNHGGEADYLFEPDWILREQQVQLEQEEQEPMCEWQHCDFATDAHDSWLFLNRTIHRYTVCYQSLLVHYPWCYKAPGLRSLVERLAEFVGLLKKTRLIANTSGCCPLTIPRVWNLDKTCLLLSGDIRYGILHETRLLVEPLRSTRSYHTMLSASSISFEPRLATTQVWRKKLTKND